MFGNSKDNSSAPYKEAPYESLYDKRSKAVLDLLEIQQRMGDAVMLINESCDNLLRKNCSISDRRDHVNLLKTKIIPILDITQLNISSNIKILSPIGGLIDVHKTEEASRKRKAKIADAMQQPKVAKLNNLSAPSKRIDITLATYKSVLKNIKQNKKMHARKKIPLPTRKSTLNTVLPPLFDPADGSTVFIADGKHSRI